MSRRISKIGLIVVVGLLCLSLPIFSACGGGGGGGGNQTTGIPYKNDGDFVQETIGEISSLDPAWAYDTAGGEQIQYMYETLIFFDGTSTGTFVNVLADDYTVDGTTIRFHIRPNVHFSNGDLLTPADVAYSIQRVMIQNRSGGPAWMLLLPLTGYSGTRSGGAIRPGIFDKIMNAVQVDGEYVVINQNPATAYGTTVLLQILCSSWGAIVDKQWCIANGEWDGTADLGTGNSTAWYKYNNPTKQSSYLYNHAMGTGPWKLDVWAPGDYIRLLKNDTWWKGTPPFNMVLTKKVDEWTSRKLSLLNGDADFVYVPRNYIGELAGIADLNAIKDLPDIAIESLFFNFDIDPNSEYIGSGALDGNGIPTDFFSDVNVRKGFAYCFNWDTYINDALQGEAEQRGSPIVKGLTYYSATDDANLYSYDPVKAEQYLKAAWDGTLWDTGFRFTLSYNIGNDPRRIACEILADNLMALNPKFRVDVLAIEWDVFLDKMCTQPCDMPIWCVGWQVDYPDADDFISPYMASYGDFAYFQGYGNDATDALIEQARYSTDPAERQALYNQLAGIFYDDCPTIMTAQPLGRRFFTKYIHGFYFNPVIFGQPGPLWVMSKSQS
jgi:peptide/nickel transport system substrate-binding protein